MYRYEYTVDSDETFPNKKVDLARLTQEIEQSNITIALAGCLHILGGNCCIDFKSELSNSDHVILDQLILNHSGDPLPDAHTLSDGTPIVSLYSRQEDNIPLVAIAPRKGNEWVIGSHNFADPCSWFGDSVRSRDEVLTDSGDGLTFNSAHQYWIDMISGRMHNDDMWVQIQQASTPLDPHGYQIEVRINGVHAVMRDPFKTSGGDYEILWEEGKIIFFENQSGKTITASYSYANGSTFYIRIRQPGTSINIEDAETDISSDIIMHDNLSYSWWYYSTEISDWVMVGGYTFKRTSQIITEARGSYPTFNAVGAEDEYKSLSIKEFRRKSRGMLHDRQTVPFNYSTIRSIVAGTELRIKLDNDVPFSGEHVSITFYCTEL